jgi:ADP-ribosylglycohydrolase
MSKIKAGLWGALVADAMGVPHEFKSASAIPQVITMVMPPEYKKTYPRVDYGAWSDDGSGLLCVADTLGTKKTLDLDHFANNLVQWYGKGRFTVDGKAFDIGNTTQESVLRLVRGHSPTASGLTQESANGNGSLMRTLALALWHQGSDAELYAAAGVLSAVTHAHDFSKAACGVYCIAARHMMRGETPARAWLAGLQHIHIPNLPIPPKPEGSGYVLDSLAYAIQASRSGKPYREVVLDAIRLGADTDTTAMIAGGLVAARDGMDCIPTDWLNQLRGRTMAEPIINALAAE